jgi:cytochrome c oxidase subunit II
VRRGSIVQLVLIGVVVGAASAAIALWIPWLPPAASKERDRIDFVFWFTTAICIGIFALVAALILYSVIKFRVKPDDDSDGPPVHGHTMLEIVWTAVPAVLVTAISIVSGIVLTQNDRIPKSSDRLTVEVSGQQFAWSFKYPDYDDLTIGTLRLPLGKPVLLRVGAVDVIHSFWVPQFGQKQDALPDQTNNLVITPNKLGTYPVICTELCGLGHAVMRSSAVVMRPAAFDAWIEEQQRKVRQGGATGGQAVYAGNGCGSCHVFGPAGSEGTIGPDLDKLPEQARRANRGSLEQFVRESIVNPNVYIEPDYAPNVMPSSYTTLPDEQLDALVQFLVSGSRGG